MRTRVSNNFICALGTNTLRSLCTLISFLFTLSYTFGDDDVNQVGNYYSINGLTFRMCDNFEAYLESCGRGDIVIPSSITSTFWENYYATHVEPTDPQLIVPPPDVAYKDGTYTVVAIDPSVFRDSRITSVTFPNTIKGIPSGAFAFCDQLEWVSFPESLVFFGCKAEGKSYSEFKEGNASEMFYNCFKLKEITIPNCAKTIGEDMFSQCFSLTEVKIPNSVTSIGSYAFLLCKNLESITIPNSVISIGNSVFSGCEKLLNIYSEIEEPFDISEKVFDKYTYENAILHVPQGTKSKYLKCTGWKNFIHIHEIGEYDMTQLTVTVNVTDGGKVIFRETEVRNDSKDFDVQTFFGRDLMFDIIPDDGYHIKSVTRNDVDVTDKLEREEGIIRYIQYEALSGLTLDVSFEKDSQEPSLGVFSARTPEGVEMTFKVLDAEQKLVQVGVGLRGQPAITVSDISDLIIPSEINGYKVAAIGEYAFADCTNLRSVSIPWTAGFSLKLEESEASNRIYSMWVRDHAFSGCSNITSVVITADIEPGISDLDYPLHWITDNVFDASVFQNAVLDVPYGYKELFQSLGKWAWCEFKNIVESANTDNPIVPNTPNSDGTYIEYFIDKDPGYGKATIVKEIGTGNNNVEIELTGVKPGAHIFYLRSHDENGHWSATVSRPLYVRPLIYIAEIEYFFDNNDPGQGRATKISLPSNRRNPFDMKIPLGNLSLGRHQLNVRVKGDDGLWSHVVSEAFTIGENTGISEVGIDCEPVAVYTLKGYQVNGQKGINIILYKDGTTKKVIIK